MQVLRCDSRCSVSNTPHEPKHWVHLPIQSRVASRSNSSSPIEVLRAGRISFLGVAFPHKANRGAQLVVRQAEKLTGLLTARPFVY